MAADEGSHLDRLLKLSYRTHVDGTGGWLRDFVAEAHSYGLDPGFHRDGDGSLCSSLLTPPQKFLIDRPQEYRLAKWVAQITGKASSWVGIDGRAQERSLQDRVWQIHQAQMAGDVLTECHHFTKRGFFLQQWFRALHEGADLFLPCDIFHALELPSDRRCFIKWAAGDARLARTAGNHPYRAVFQNVDYVGDQYYKRCCIPWFVERGEVICETEQHLLFSCPAYCDIRADADLEWIKATGEDWITSGFSEDELFRRNWTRRNDGLDIKRMRLIATFITRLMAHRESKLQHSLRLVGGRKLSWEEIAGEYTEEEFLDEVDPEDRILDVDDVPILPVDLVTTDIHCKGPCYRNALAFRTGRGEQDSTESEVDSQQDAESSVSENDGLSQGGSLCASGNESSIVETINLGSAARGHCGWVRWSPAPDLHGPLSPSGCRSPLSSVSLASAPASWVHLSVCDSSSSCCSLAGSLVSPGSGSRASACSRGSPPASRSSGSSVSASPVGSGASFPASSGSGFSRSGASGPSCCGSSVGLASPFSLGVSRSGALGCSSSSPLVGPSSGVSPAGFCSSPALGWVPDARQLSPRNRVSFDLVQYFAFQSWFAFLGNMDRSAETIRQRLIHVADKPHAIGGSHDASLGGSPSIILDPEGTEDFSDESVCSPGKAGVISAYRLHCQQLRDASNHQAKQKRRQVCDTNAAVHRGFLELILARNERSALDRANLKKDRRRIHSDRGNGDRSSIEAQDLMDLQEIIDQRSQDELQQGLFSDI